MTIKYIIVFGGGAAGSNILNNLLYTHPGLQYTVVDFDTVEERNISAGTQPYTKSDLRRPKTQALQRMASMTQGKRIKSLCAKIESLKDITKLVPEPSETILIDAFDNAKSRNLFLKLGKQYNVLHVGFSDSLTGEAVWNELYSEMAKSESDAEIDVCEMHMARSFIMALTAIASLVIAECIDYDKKKNVYFDKSFRIKVF